MYMLQEMAIQIDSLPVFYRQRDTLFYPSVIFTSFYPCHPCLHLTWMPLLPVSHANPFNRLTVQVLLNASGQAIDKSVTPGPNVTSCLST